MSKLNLNVDPAASVYALVERTQRESSLLNNRQSMLIISHELENALLKNEVRARIFSSFQRMSRFLPQVQRYRKLSYFAESIYVFGIMDVTPPPISRIHFVPLKEGDQLAKEWFLLADSPQFYSALATEEIEGQQDDQQQPMFRGVWTFDEELITIMQEWLTHLVGANPLSDLSARRDYRQQISLMTSTMFRLTNRLMDAVGKVNTLTQQDSATTIQLSAAVEKQIGPSVQTLADKMKASGLQP